MKMKILPSRLDGFENYPDLPESTETLSPRVRAREKKKNKGREKLRDASILVTEDISVSFFKSQNYVTNFFRNWDCYVRFVMFRDFYLMFIR